jgi:copper transporter 1
MDHSMHMSHDMGHDHMGHGDMDMGGQCNMNASTLQDARDSDSG